MYELHTLKDVAERMSVSPRTIRRIMSDIGLVLGKGHKIMFAEKKVEQIRDALARKEMRRPYREVALRPEQPDGSRIRMRRTLLGMGQTVLVQICGPV